MTEFLTISAITLLLILAWRNSGLAIRNYKLKMEVGELRTDLAIRAATCICECMPDKFRKAGL